MRRTDGICPKCTTRPINPGEPYCIPCRREYRYQANLIARGIKPKNQPQKLSLDKCLPVVKLLAEGMEHKHISRRLGLGVRAVAWRMKWLRRHSQTKTDAQLAVWAVRQGLV